jgi:hypothetical protein
MSEVAMAASTMRTVWIPGVAIVAFAGGLAIGQRMFLSSMLSMVAAETTGNLAVHVEMLARLRTGDAPAAIDFLEQSVDAATPEPGHGAGVESTRWQHPGDAAAGEGVSVRLSGPALSSRAHQSPRHDSLTKRRVLQPGVAEDASDAGWPLAR